MQNLFGFIGAGRMAQALAGGIANFHPQSQFVITDPNGEARERFRNSVTQNLNQDASQVQKTISVVETTQEVFDRTQTVFLAVKPQFFEQAIAGLRVTDSATHLIVSVMAGVTIARIRQLTRSSKIIRTMPNTPCLVKQGAIAVSATPAVTAAELNTLLLILKSLGTVELLDESLLDAVTGLSGSGPAYVFSFIEALTRGGIAAGLASEVADRLARQTVLGAATMLVETHSTPGTLREQVSSPGGTTLAGLSKLKERHFEMTVVEAILAATARSQELSQL